MGKEAPLTFREYQERASRTAIYPDIEGKGFIYPAFGLGGEVGEILEILKKVLRDKEGEIDEKPKKN